MNSKLVWALPTALFLVGCQADNVKMHHDSDGCVVLEIPDKCRGSRKNPQVNINLRTMKVNPANVCAEPGTTLTVNISPGQPLESLQIYNKADGPEAPWLNASNGKGKYRFEIPIPEGVKDGEYAYGINSDLGCIDPRVNIKR